MTGALYHWQCDIEADVRIVMRAEHLTDLSLPARKQWARSFIQQYVPGWSHDVELRWTEQQAFGSGFLERLAAAKRALKKVQTK